MPVQSATVFIWNTTYAPFSITINDSDPTSAIAIPGASAAQNWAPVTPTGNEPVLQLTQSPGPGAFGPIQNIVNVYLSRSELPQPIVVDLTNNLPIEVISAQMYFFFQNPTTLSWIFQINGQPPSQTGSIAYMGR